MGGEVVGGGKEQNICERAAMLETIGGRGHESESAQLEEAATTCSGRSGCVRQ